MHSVQNSREQLIPIFVLSANVFARKVFFLKIFLVCIVIAGLFSSHVLLFCFCLSFYLPSGTQISFAIGSVQDCPPNRHPRLQAVVPTRTVIGDIRTSLGTVG